MGYNRKLTRQEKKLLDLLIAKASITFPVNWEEGLLVRTMNDGGMGSLYMYPNGKTDKDRVFGTQVSELQFTDIDGVRVIVSLNVDSNGHLYELDIWKTDFGELKKIPEF